MKILLATGIYPPDIGGPATYVKALAEELVQRGMEVCVVSYGRQQEGEEGQKRQEGQPGQQGWEVIRVSMYFPIIRWFRYTSALKKYGSDADIVYAFSSVSCGVPLLLARLKKPKKILRLGGDFLWERATDHGSRLSLREWYGKRFQWSIFRMSVPLMGMLLRRFDLLIFSSKFQYEIYQHAYRTLPACAVVENALPQGQPQSHLKHTPFRLLFMGRYVAFKHLPVLIQSLSKLSVVSLTCVGEGPMRGAMDRSATTYDVLNRVTFLPPAHGAEKEQLFREHDLLVLPSLTELTPNVALEARAAGLPVLLTDQTGLSPALADGMIVHSLRTPEDIAAAVQEIMERYPAVAEAATGPVHHRPWATVAEDHVRLFHEVLS